MGVIPCMEKWGSKFPVLHRLCRVGSLLDSKLVGGYVRVHVCARV